MKRRRSRAQAGAALLEFVIVTPFLALLLVGLIETARYAYFAIVVGNAARAGVQYGAQNGSTALDTAGMQAAARADGANHVASLSVTSSHACYCWNGTAKTATSCTPVPTCASGHPVMYVTVTATGTAHALLNYYLIPSTMTVSQSATMRIVNQ